MTIQHKDIPEAQLHEAKGVVTAANGSFLKANAGAGIWAFDEDFIDLDIASLTTVTTYNLIMPHTGTITKIYTVIDGAIGVSDAVLTLSIAGVAVTNGAVTISFSGSAAGDIDSTVPSALNTATQGQRLSLAVTGGPTGATRCHVSIIFLRTA